MHLKLMPNPSHLEAVDPVVLGFSRAKADVLYNSDYDKILPILIHGDASVAGQGVVYEILQMCNLEGYYTGGTMHFVTPQDSRWMLKLSEARMLKKAEARMMGLNIDESLVNFCKDLFREALRDKNVLTRQEMMALLEKEGITTKEQRGYHLLWQAAQRGVICMGPMQEKKQTFMLLEDWTSEGPELSRDEALGELALRYIASHGPATVHDFAWWAGLYLPDARRGIEIAEPKVIFEKRNGEELWSSLESPSPEPIPGPSIRLLPSFDEYLIGYKERSEVLDAEHIQEVSPGSNGTFHPIVVVDGRVSGIWKQDIRKNGLDLNFIFFVPIPYEKELIYREAERYSDFLDLQLATVTIAIRK
jgi:hypothetical protein